MENRETEYKWRINDKTEFKKIKKVLDEYFPGYIFSAPLLSDTYFDTSSFTLSEEKSALRLRRISLAGRSRYELTFKSASAIKGGLARRREITIPLNCRTRAAALKAFHAKAAEVNPKAVGLKPVFSIHNRRKVFYIKHKTFEAELSFDNCLIKAGRHMRMLEAELEHKGGKIAAFKRFAAILARGTGLKPSVKSKVATARALLAEK